MRIFLRIFALYYENVQGVFGRMFTQYSENASGDILQGIHTIFRECPGSSPGNIRPIFGECSDNVLKGIRLIFWECQGNTHADYSPNILRMSRDTFCNVFTQYSGKVQAIALVIFAQSSENVQGTLCKLFRQ